MNEITLVTGGNKSGKSRYALNLASPHEKKVFIATAEPFDKDMNERIAKHQRERGDDFKTIEEPLNPARAIESAQGMADVIVIDCLTLWVNNLLYRHKNENKKYNEIENFFKIIQSPHCSIIIVTNEVGMGIIPDNPLSRKFADQAGELNQRTALVADRVIFMVSGIPVIIKGE